MLGTGSGDSTRQYLAAFGDESTQSVDVLVICLYLLCTELADLPSKIRPAAASTAAKRPSAAATVSTIRS